MVPTASFHLVKPCNMQCKFCYATFQDFKVIKQLPAEEARNILYKLKAGGLEKITFAGGEPLLYRDLSGLIKFAKTIGLTTSIITNGSLLKVEWLKELVGYLDWVGISIDSLKLQTNLNAGRRGALIPFGPTYESLIHYIKLLGFKLKINTVVHAYNHMEDMNEFINFAAPLRWKVFQALRVEGQNDEHWNEIKVSHKQYMNYIYRHQKQQSMVPEDNELMTGSYLLIDPLGRLFENSKGQHTYSSPLQNNKLSECLKQISINTETFKERGGVYAW